MLLVLATAPAVAAELTPSYSGSSVCAGCHATEARSWRSSHHAWAWKLPSSESVLGDFDATTFAHRGKSTRFETRNGHFFLITEGPDGVPAEYRVIGAVGVAPLQQYLVETQAGRLQVLDTAWDHVAKRWYHLYPDQDLPPGDGLHWSGPYKNWNARCAECHATGYEKRYDPSARRYASTQAEIGVGCEACHGPGEAHVAWARDPGGFDPAAWPGTHPSGLTIAFDANHAEAEIQQCAGCHSRREPIGDASPRPGTLFADSYRLALLWGDLYHADGQIKEEVYEYGSFLQSKMYARGVRCSSCHEPHSTKLRAEGNAVCAQCHRPAGNPDFPSLKKAAYDTPNHHFHKPGTDGAECKSCHMIERVYMGIDGRRDHSFRVPRPDLTVSLGTPNACNDCHRDKSGEWAAAEVARRFPDSAHRGPTFAKPFAAAWNDVDEASTIEGLLNIAFDQAGAGIIRATALALLQRYATPQIADRTAPALRDTDPLVRAAALPLQRPASLPVRVERIVPLLQDPMKSVRIEAARSLLDVPRSLYPSGAGPIASSAIGEYRTSLVAKADFPESQMAIAGTALTLRDFPAAEQAFAEAVRMDPQLVDGWVMLARIRMAEGRLRAAEEALRDGLAANPGHGPLMDYLEELRNAAPSNP